MNQKELLETTKFDFVMELNNYFQKNDVLTSFEYLKLAEKYNLGKK